ncbi:hypothetical protein M758_8G005000 [Ceratodon purpureus]|nr:hypothetical protein KC19_8G005600 [Ceratodon purpureus]KAG0607139.1 hypothetical protein M758_8G005000 [Ceratodon purpureus]
MTIEHGKSEKSVSELDQELLEEGELEDGELSGGCDSGEDDDDTDNADPMNFRDVKHEEDGAEEDDEEGIVDYRTEGLTPVVVRFGVDGRINQATVGGLSKQLAKDHKKNSKRRKGKGALSRQRKRSRVEKAQKGSNEPIIDMSLDGRQHGEHVTSTTRVESSGADRNGGEKQQQSGCNIIDADTGPEEGEVIEEDNRGLLSQLVEEEVGLWTTDVGDEQITSSKIDSDGDGKKKVRAPISAERKFKKKVAFRRKRAEKEKELGIRRPRLPVSTFKPKVPLCKFYIKGRCTLGAKCTFSHDVVPITKSDPCKFFMVNRCLKGDDCPFSHALDTFPCKFWHMRGHCLDGTKCRFSHGPLTDDQRQNLARRIEHDSKEQLNVPDIPTDLNNAPQDSESEYMLTVNNSHNEALGWDVNPSQALNQDTTCYASTSMASHSLLNNREVSSAALRMSIVSNQSSVVLAEVNKEEIQLADTHKEDTPAENAVLLAARKAASAAAVQAAGTIDKLLLSRSGSVTGISLPKSRSFGRSLVGRGNEASAMDLLQASFSSDGGRDLSSNANSSSQAVSNTGTFSALALSSAGAGTGAVGDMMFPSSSPLSRAAPSSLTRGSSFGHTRQVVVPGNKASAMELLQASLGNKAIPDGNIPEVDFLGL